MGGSLFLVAVLAVAGPEVQVRDLDGTISRGALEYFSEAQVRLGTEHDSVVLSTDRLLELTPVNHPAAADRDQPGVWIELTDGSRLVASEFTMADGQAKLKCDRPETQAVALQNENRMVSMPARAIRMVRFSKPDTTSAPAWPAKVGTDATGDLLAVIKKDRVDFLDGTVVSVNDTHIVFRVDGETIPVNRAKASGFILFQKAGDELPAPLVDVQDMTGWRLKGKDLLLRNGALEVTTVAGPSFHLPFDQVARVDFSSGKITYLSDLEPESIQWTPYLDFGNGPGALAQYYAPRRDEGREHQPIRLGGKTYNKGLSLYSRTALAYRLPAGMKKFQAIAGIDDSVRDGGNVRLEISADGKKLFDQTITGKDAPIDINLDIEGAKRLSILVDYGDDSDAGDYLNLAEARTLK